MTHLYAISVFVDDEEILESSVVAVEDRCRPVKRRLRTAGLRAQQPE